MDLIPRQKPNSIINNPDAGNFIKSRGILVSGKGYDLSFLKGRWTMLSLLCVFLALLAFGATKGYTYYIDRQIAGLKEKIEIAESKHQNQLSLSLGEIEAIIKIVDKLLASHIFSSSFFGLLERLTLPEVEWDSLNLDAVSGNADLRGKAVSYSFLAKQIINFEKEKIQISVSGISLGREGVGFSAKLKFDPALLKK